MSSSNCDLPIYTEEVTNQEAGNSAFYYKGFKMWAAPGVHEDAIRIIRSRLRPGSRVLELGAGSGAFTLRLREAGLAVDASGINPDAFSLSDVPYHILNLNEPLPETHHGAYEGVLAVEVIEHLENIFEFFQKVHLLLQTGGMAFITTPNISSVKSRLMFMDSGNFFLFNAHYVNDWGHIQILPHWLLAGAAARAGLECLEIRGLARIEEVLDLNWYKRIVYRIVYISKNLLYKEEFPGEFSSSCLMLVLRKN